MRNTVVLLVSLMAGAASAQNTAPRHLAPKGLSTINKDDKRPVTADEALAVLKETRRVLSAGIGHPIPGSIGIKPGSAPVTREQIVIEFDRELEAMKPQMKFTPNPVDIDAEYIRIAPNLRADVIKLVRLGFVGRVAPLVTGPKDTMGVGEFGDAVGFFVSRMAQLTHMPSPKWSPMLGAGS